MASAGLGALLTGPHSPQASERRMATDSEAVPQATQTLTSQEMLGKNLRVIHPMERITMDYSEDRINIEVDENNCVVRVFIG